MYHVDQERLGYQGITGYKVRAVWGTKWGTYDVACLDADSFSAWCKKQPESVALDVADRLSELNEEN